MKTETLNINPQGDILSPNLYSVLISALLMSKPQQQIKIIWLVKQMKVHTKVMLISNISSAMSEIRVKTWF